MKSFRWILFLACIVIVSCSFAGSLKENLPMDECYHIQTYKNRNCPERCNMVGAPKIPNPMCPDKVCPDEDTMPYLCGKLPKE
jgi:hypothetical protein